MRLYLLWLAVLVVGIILSCRPEPPTAYEKWRSAVEASERLQEADREVQRFLSLYGHRLFTGNTTGLPEVPVDRELIQYALDRGAAELPVVIDWNSATVGELVDYYDAVIRLSEVRDGQSSPRLRQAVPR